MTTYVEIRQVGRRIAVPEGGTILEAALADSIAYPHGCRSGRCGSCKSPLVSGEVAKNAMKNLCRLFKLPHNKTELVGKVLSILQVDTEMHQKFAAKFLKRLAQRLG
jgi:ferredoxin